MAEIGVLELQIKDDSQYAGDGLQHLAEGLSAVKDAMKNFSLTRVGTQVTALAQAINSAKGTSTTIKNLSSLFNSIARFSQLKDIEIPTQPFEDLKTAIGDGFKIGQAGTQLNKLHDAMTAKWDMSKSAVTAMNNIAGAAQRMEANGTAATLSAVGKGLTAFSKGIEGLANASVTADQALSNTVSKINDNLKSKNQDLAAETKRMLEEREAAGRKSLMKLNLQQFASKKQDITDSVVGAAGDWRSAMYGIKDVNKALSQTDTSSVGNIKDLTSALKELDKLAGGSNLKGYSEGLTKIANACDKGANSYRTLGRLATSIDKVKGSLEGFRTPNFKNLIDLAQALQENYNAETNLRKLAEAMELLKAASDGFKMPNVKALEKTGADLGSKVSSGVAEETKGAFHDVSEQIQEQVQSTVDQLDFSKFDVEKLPLGNLGMQIDEASGHWVQYADMVKDATQTVADMGATDSVRGLVEVESETQRVGDATNAIIVYTENLEQSWDDVFKKVEETRKRVEAIEAMRKAQEEKFYAEPTIYTKEQTDAMADNIREVDLFKAKLREAEEEYNKLVNTLGQDSAKTIKKGLDVSNLRDKIWELGQSDETIEEITAKLTPIESQVQRINEELGRPMDWTGLDEGIERMHGIGAACKPAEESMRTFLEAMEGTDEAAARLRENNPDLSGFLTQMHESGVQAKDFTSKLIDVDGELKAKKKDAGDAANSFGKLKKATEESARGVASASEKIKSAKNEIGNTCPMLDRLISKIGRIAEMMLIRTAIRAVMNAAKEGLQNFYNYSKSISNTYYESMSKLKAQWEQIKNQMGAAIGTTLTAILPILQGIATAAIAALNAITALFAVLNGKSTYSQATLDLESYSKTASGAAKANKDLLASFDELNVIQSSSGGGGGGSGLKYSDMFTDAPVPSWLQEWRPLIEAVIGGTLGAIILPKIFDWIKKIIGLFGGEGITNALDILKKMLKLKDGDDGDDGGLDFDIDVDLPDITGDVATMFGYAAAVEAAKLALEGLKDTLLEVKGALEGISLLSTILNTLISLAGSFLGGTIKISVNREAFDKFKDEYNTWIKDTSPKVINITYNLLEYMGYQIKKGEIDAWLADRKPKVIDITFNVLQYMGYQIKKNEINTWLADRTPKVISISIDAVAYMKFMLVQGLVDAWASARPVKTIGIGFDSTEYVAFILVKDKLELWLYEHPTKYVNIAFDGLAYLLFTTQQSEITEWVNDKFVKSIGIAFNLLEYAVFLTQKSVIDGWIKETKRITVAFDQVAYAVLLAEIAVIKTWVDGNASKTIGIALDPAKYSEFLSQKNDIEGWITKGPKKVIEVAALEDQNLKNIRDWCKTTDEKTIKLNIDAGTGSGGSGSGGGGGNGNIFSQNIFKTTVDDIWKYFNTHDLPTVAKDFWDGLATSLGIKPAAANQPSIEIKDAVEVKDQNNGFGTEVQKEIKGSVEGTVGTVKASINATDVIDVDHKDFIKDQKKEFGNDIDNAYDTNEAHQKAKKAGNNIGDNLKAGMGEKNSIIEQQAQEWWDLIDGKLKVEHIIKIKEDKMNIETVKKNIKNDIELLRPVVQVDFNGPFQQFQQRIQDLVKPTVTTGFTGDYEGFTNTIQSNVTPTISSLLGEPTEKQYEGLQGQIQSGVTPTITVKLVAGDMKDFTNSVMKAVAAGVNGVSVTIEDSTIQLHASYTLLANGGLVNSGDIFVANENGRAEMIGRFGNQAAVANQEQMVEAMARGVQYANADQNAILRQQNELLRAILRKENTLKIGASTALGRVARQSINMYENAAGV